MGAGWHIEDSNGEVYKAWYRAIDAYLADPTLRFYEAWIEMSGSKSLDATDEVARRADLALRRRPTE